MNFGDPIWPVPSQIEIPRLVPVDLPSVTLLGYPLTMVLAEKIVTAVDRGTANTRWRDFADVYTLTRLHPVEGREFREFIMAVADYRNVKIAPLLPALSPMNELSQQNCRAWRMRSNRHDEIPEAIADLLVAVSDFADPILALIAVGRWNPQLAAWE